MKYLKKFKSNADYILYKNSDEYITPNVCLIENTDEVHYQVNIPPVAVLFTAPGTSKNVKVYGRDLGTPGVFSNSDIPISKLESTFGEVPFIYVTFEDTITTINDSAFGDFSKPMSVNIGKNVTNIGNNAFAGSAINYIDFSKVSNNLTTIGDGAFYGSFFNSNITSQFYHGSMEQLIIPEGVTTIGEEAFAYTETSYNGDLGRYELLSEVILPTTLTAIGDGLFKNSYLSDGFYLPNSLTTIPELTFNHCNYSIKIICGYTLSPSLNGDIRVITIGGETIDTTRISDGGIYISDSVTSIGDMAFRAFDYLDYDEGNIQIESLGDGFGPVVMGNSITSIGSQAFTDVPTTQFALYATTPPTLAEGDSPGTLDDPFPYWEYDDGENPVERLLAILVPNGSGTAYQTAWPHLADYIFEMR